mmetsp:Transcript_2857/g.4609  ORF Transcript_2857/g.4609 Transcript_2857/m.4609 type:complete len:341 (+) Transcript_2857:203-1225(+)
MILFPSQNDRIHRTSVVGVCCLFLVGLAFAGSFLLKLDEPFMKPEMKHRLLAASSSSPPSKQQQNKTLVIIIGTIRGGEKAWQTLYDNVLDPNDADLALLIGNVQEQYSSSSLLSLAKHTWQLEEYDDWGDAVDLIDGPKWRTDILPLLQPGSALGPLPGQAGSGAIIFMIRWFLSKKIQELGLTNTYDRFVITRADHYYLCKHDLKSLSLDNLWVPFGQDYTGLTDRHLVVSNRDVLTALDILPHIFQNFDAYSDKLGRGPRPFGTMHTNPEILIQRRFELAGLTPRIKHFDRMMFTCAMPGDATRWQRAGTEFVPEGVLLKYEREYQLSHQYCDAQPR